MPLPEMAVAVFAAGGRWLLLREKDLAPDAQADLVRALVETARPHGARVSVSADVAAAGSAHGLHLPRDGDVITARRTLGPTALIGLSAHDRDEAERAVRDGADYVTLSPIFPSASKPGYGPALGPTALHEIASALPIPVLALGGVTAANAADCLAAGAAGLAVMGSVMAAADPGAAMVDLLRVLPNS